MLSPQAIPVASPGGHIPLHRTCFETRSILATLFDIVAGAHIAFGISDIIAREELRVVCVDGKISSAQTARRPSIRRVVASLQTKARGSPWVTAKSGESSD
eukprot:scaffold16444_cov29-Tisochrysis_lutea.AAC.8